MTDAGRYEIKCVVDAASSDRIECWVALHPAAFRERYAERRVNNVYFDTPELACFEQNLSGASERAKCRLRWYGPMLETTDGVLEIKEKRNLRGTKRQHALRLSSPLGGLSFREIRAQVGSQIPDTSRSLFETLSEPVLLSHFHRRYFESFDRRIRVTLDRDLTFYDQRFRDRPTVGRKAHSASIVIVECKFASADADFARRAIVSLPGRMTKCSKYALGMEWLLGY